MSACALLSVSSDDLISRPPFPVNCELSPTLTASDAHHIDWAFGRARTLYQPNRLNGGRMTELLDKAEVLRLFGGSRPINASTLYRGIKLGRYPKPVRVGPNSSRWLLSECRDALRSMVEERNA